MKGKQADEKTNVMRILDQKKVQYESHCYADTDAVSGAEVAAVLGQNPDRVVKTLVTEGHSKNHYVFMIPVEKELDLKKVAKASKDKKVEMIHMKELLPLTGYMRGGCSPIGMKKKFPTWFDESVAAYDRITVSAGIRGAQLAVPAEKLLAYLGAETATLTRKP